MTIVTGDILRAKVITAFPTGDEFTNILTYKVDNVGSATESEVFDALAERMQIMYSGVGPDLSSAVTVPAMDIEQLVVATNKFVTIGSRSLTVVGTASIEAMPGVSTGSVTGRTNVSKVRGRKSVGGYGETRGQDGILSPAALGRLAVYAAQYLTGINVAPLNLLLIPGVFRTVALVFQEFNGGGLVKNIMGTMTTRKALRGS